jgi:glycerol uptake facilitator-like aquaporin
MEVANGKHNKPIVCLYEALGTGMLVYSILVSKDSPDQNFAITFCLFASICIAGPISGGNLNPAVTLGVFTSN